MSHAEQEKLIEKLKQEYEDRSESYNLRVPVLRPVITV